MTIVCDGCGQAATAGHLARRLKRLENMTKYRPVHVQVLFLAAVSPAAEAEYLYSTKTDSRQDDSAKDDRAEAGTVEDPSKEGKFLGEGARILQAVGMEPAGRSGEATLVEFQRRGYLLAHVLECPAEQDTNAIPMETVRKRFPATIARIRRSFKPKRLVLLGTHLTEMVPQLVAANLDASLVLRNGKPFEWSEIGIGDLAKELTAAL